MIKIYLDMDGVVANFDKAYRTYDPQKEDRKKFRSAVMDYKIFEDLEPMPNANILLSHVSQFRDVNIEMLTSMGTFDAAQGAEAKRQKLVWLRKHNIKYKANFVRSKQEKANYASFNSILVDDSPGCINPFIAAGGQGILHSDSIIRSTLMALDSIILQLRAVQALRQ